MEEIEDKVIQKMRYLDKLIDEPAKGKAMEKILRKQGNLIYPWAIRELEYSKWAY